MILDSQKLYSALRPLVSVVLVAFIAVVCTFSEWLPQCFANSEQRSSKKHSQTIHIALKDTNHLRQVLAEQKYCLSRLFNGKNSVPRVFFANFPKDLRKIRSLQDKKNLFIQVILPMVLRINEEILHERDKLLDLKAKHEAKELITDAEQKWLLSLCNKYKMKKINFTELVRRVDIIPPSMAIGQSIIESGWGGSFAARKKNSPFGMTISSKVKFYDNLLDSTFYYVRNLNSNPAYQKMRIARAKMRQQGKEIDCYTLIGELKYYSEERGVYMRKVRSAIRKNDLQRFDKLRLIPSSEETTTAIV